MLTGPQGLSEYVEEQCAGKQISDNHALSPAFTSCPVGPQFTTQTACWLQGDGTNMEIKLNM